MARKCVLELPNVQVRSQRGIRDAVRHTRSMAALIRAELAKWGTVVKEAGINLQ
jgi:hypothetical protein